MKKLLVMAMSLSLLACGNRNAPAEEAGPIIMKLYPAGAAESNNLEGTEKTDERNFISNTSDAELHIYLPKGESNGQMVVVCPGGGYRGVAFGHEGIKAAEWMNTHGIAAAVLKYRMPNGNHDIPLKDALTAMETVRANAQEWDIDPSGVGVMGFSAGGHLASCVTTLFTSDANRPDFSVLIYPVISMQDNVHTGSRRNLLGSDGTKELKDRYSTNLQVGSDTPPVFIAFCDDDKTVDPRNGTMFYDALKANGIPGELHIYPTGGHGWGFDDARTEFTARSEFYTSLERWLRNR